MTHSKQGGCSQPLLHCLLPQHATTIARLTASKVMQPALAALLVASTSHKNCMTHSKQGDAASPCCMACCFNKPQDLHDSQQAMWMQPALAACLVAFVIWTTALSLHITQDCGLFSRTNTSRVHALVPRAAFLSLHMMQHCGLCRRTNASRMHALKPSKDSSCVHAHDAGWWSV